MPLSASVLAAMYDETTSEQPVTLLTIHDPDKADAGDWPFRICDQGDDVVSSGDTYASTAFEAIPPDQENGGSEQMRLGIIGPTDDIVRELQAVSGAPPVDVVLVLASDPDTTIRSWPGLVIRDIKADRLSMSFELRFEELDVEVFPPERFSFPLYPGLY